MQRRCAPIDRALPVEVEQRLPRSLARESSPFFLGGNVFLFPVATRLVFRSGSCCRMIALYCRGFFLPPLSQPGFLRLWTRTHAAQKVVCRSVPPDDPQELEAALNRSASWILSTHVLDLRPAYRIEADR